MTPITPLALVVALWASEPEIASPEDTIVIPPGRPEWVSLEPALSGDVHQIPVSSGPYARDADARRALDQALIAAASDYIAEYLGSRHAPRFLGYDARTIKRRFVHADNLYHDRATYSVGPMYEYFALLEFDAAARKELEKKWDQVKATSRLAQTGLFAGAALLLVASVFGYFRLDNATRGYYTGRLQFLTAAAILAVLGTGAMLAQWIAWI